MNPLRPSLRAIPSILTSIPSRPQLPTRTFATTSTCQAQKTFAKKDSKDKEKGKRRKKHVMYKMPDLTQITQYSLCDAMQFIRAFEVGRDPGGPKYDLAVRFKTRKDGPIVRNTIRLPHAVKTDIRVCVICDPSSKAGKQAKDAGAALVGLDEVIDLVKSGKIDFDRCITTPDTLPRLMKEGLPRILGPRGLMPSVKLGTVTENVATSVRSLLGGSTYRERTGVIRMAIGQLAFSPEMLRENIKTFLSQVKKEAAALGDTQNIYKDVFEVVLSSTHSPGFSLNGEFKGPESVPAQLLAVN